MYDKIQDLFPESDYITFRVTTSLTEEIHRFTLSIWPCVLKQMKVTKHLLLQQKVYEKGLQITIVSFGYRGAYALAQHWLWVTWQPCYCECNIAIRYKGLQNLKSENVYIVFVCRKMEGTDVGYVLHFIWGSGNSKHAVYGGVYANIQILCFRY